MVLLRCNLGSDVSRKEMRQILLISVVGVGRRITHVRRWLWFNACAYASFTAIDSRSEAKQMQFLKLKMRCRRARYIPQMCRLASVRIWHCIHS